MRHFTVIYYDGNENGMLQVWAHSFEQAFEIAREDLFGIEGFMFTAIIEAPIESVRLV